VAKGKWRVGECAWSPGVIFSFNSIIGNGWGMGNVLYIFIEVDLWLILFFKVEK